MKTNTSLAYDIPGKFEETRFEKNHNVIFDNSIVGSKAVAQEMAELIRSKQAKNKTCVLGLATGSSPIKVYEELVRMHKEEGLSFYNVISFNLDEYYPMTKENRQSYHYFMHQYLFNHIDIKPENVNIPDGTVVLEELNQYCVDYEMKIKEAGGLDFQLLGIGRTGHVGFNEPGSHINSGTRIITLDHITRVDASSDFNGIDNVPKRAITMGVSTILRSKRIVLMAWGQNKAAIIKRTIQGDISSEVPATFLQNHSNATFVLDQSSASELTRFETPWLVGGCTWTQELKSKAIVWLCKETKQSILKLTDRDYNNNGMSDLLAQEGSAYDLNINMFNVLQHTITGWPGGKPNTSDSHRPERANPAKKRVILFSPHPDDDVISMGGTFSKLIKQGHDVHVVYQTSGNIAVTDDEALKFAEVCNDFIGKDIDGVNFSSVIDFLNNKTENQVDSLEVRKLKGLIRRRESYAATRYIGLKDENTHFLDLPFYETGQIKKNPLGLEDIAIVKDIIAKIKPHQVFAAGDLADPHGTHEVCLNAIFAAMKELKTEAYMYDCWLWLYRGAWHEWDIHEIDMAVPLSPDEVTIKRHAILYHQSQKDRVMFQGNDSREFWVRAEERNKNTARLYDDLGLAEYEAIEAFKRFYY
ncbi:MULTISPECIES: glucosamine-6-phosphate deaminase [unclassified Flavobacterium]|uniref:glucosamine-6-phosphate deaminase n=1 Tax=unclassified Flavobacterium TaxID=196869 RepID=UPI000F0C0FCD|nr:MULTISPECIES: glucosamine-6-phosphate deaminase [unclassified Flavobacterium]AYN06478.1 glucosamine-6-phosphate deaminase [Flavobacterium sp. 140616W15]MCD0472946.1 glucosamine-6-phosphate deaminase [Flavobacterium sp. EDS]